MSIYFLEDIDTESEVKKLNDVVQGSRKVYQDLNKTYYLAKDENKTLNSNINTGKNATNSLQEQISNANIRNMELNKTIDKATSNTTALSSVVSSATENNKKLQLTLQDTKNYIDSLDTSKNIPQIKSDLDNIKNQLQDRKYLSYSGENITCNNTSDSATKDMVIEGATYQNICIDSNIERTVNSKHRIQEHNLVSLIPANTDFRINVNITGKKAPKFGLLMYFIDANTGTPHYDALTKEAYHQNIWVHKNYPISKIALYLEQKEIESDPTAYITYKDFSVVLDKNYNQYVEGIKSVGEENKINISSCGKNLVDITKMVNTLINTWGHNYHSKYDYINKFLNVRVNSGHNHGEGCFVILKPKTSYTVSFKINKDKISNKNLAMCFSVYLKGDCNRLHYASYSGQQCTFTTGNETLYFITLSINVTDPLPDGECMRIYDLQLEEGTTVTKCEPYKSSGVDISLPSQLGRLSKEVKDTIELINNQWFHVQRIGKTVLNGDEGWSWEQNKFKDKMGFYSWLKVSKGNNIIADKLKTSHWEDVINDNNKNKICALDGVYNVIRVGMQKSSLNPPNEEGLKKWLKENPTTVYYELAKPILTPLNMICDLKTYDGITHVFSENVIPPTLKFKVARNIGTMIHDNINRIRQIENSIKRINDLQNSENKIIIGHNEPIHLKQNDIWIEVID